MKKAFYLIIPSVLYISMVYLMDRYTNVKLPVTINEDGYGIMILCITAMVGFLLVLLMWPIGLVQQALSTLRAGMFVGFALCAYSMLKEFGIYDDDGIIQPYTVFSLCVIMLLSVGFGLWSLYDPLTEKFQRPIFLKFVPMVIILAGMICLLV